MSDLAVTQSKLEDTRILSGALGRLMEAKAAIIIIGRLHEQSPVNVFIQPTSVIFWCVLLWCSEMQAKAFSFAATCLCTTSANC